MAFRARKRGQSIIIGKYKEQYELLPRYAEEILKSNRANTVKLKLNGNVFDRIYICFEALRKGFVAGCKPFISLDGCFLKGPYGGQLLVAVGRDGNNQMFPIAWAIVEVEKTETWSWFLYLLAADLGTDEGAWYTFMSDQQKGLLAAVAEQLEKHKVWARGWNAFWDGGFSYGVRDGSTQCKYVVNLAQRTCTCNAWQVSGIPCKHAIVAIWKKVDEPEEYTSEYFRKSTYANAYSFFLEPLNGPQEWPTSQNTIIPPPLKKVNHRPKTKRNPSVGEVTEKGKLRKTGVAMNCSLCGVQGHNKTTCKNTPRESNAGGIAHHQNKTQPRLTPSTVPMHNRGVGIYTYSMDTEELLL
ncbi:uncharacterized protein LOC110689850 [Chenopodium quinoa]|uniref:uncharacterized protein LOC110689850 n=1 Tax=Chenopodium quinoa TaxID=63459 RepID=UPI000B786933|nr:uncharacterized protein LOC110689850 [Chenopodium quinoa]